MRKRKKKKNIILASVFFFIIVLSLISGFVIEKTVMTNRALDYLSEKYNAKKFEFELISYKRPNHYLNDDAIPLMVKGCYKWEFKYNERIFFVNIIDEKFCDDYQIEDVEKWCVKWFKDNIDKSIEFVSLGSDDLYAYQINSDNKVMTYESIEAFLTSDGSFRWDEMFDNNILLAVYYLNNSLDFKKLNEKTDNRLNHKSISIIFENASRIKYKYEPYKNQFIWGKEYYFVPEGVFLED